MSIWTSRVLGTALLVCAACTLQPAESSSGVAKPAPRVEVSDRQIVISGPLHYCVDLPASRDERLGAFVLLGSCAAISGTPAAGQPRAPAVLTASVWMGEGSGAVPTVVSQMPAMNAYFHSAAGLAALSRSGRAATVRLLEARSGGGVFYLYATDSSPTPGQNIQPGLWRAVFDLRWRNVTLTVTGLRSRPLSPVAGRATLEAFVRQVQGENAGLGTRVGSRGQRLHLEPERSRAKIF